MEKQTIILVLLAVLYLTQFIKYYIDISNLIPIIKSNNCFREELFRTKQEYKGLNERLQADYDKERAELRSELSKYKALNHALDLEYN